MKAFTRDASRIGVQHGRVQIVEGDAGSAAQVAEAIAGTEAVISALGPSSNRPAEVEIALAAVASILAAMKQHSVGRLIALSGAAVEVPGERKSPGDAIASAVVRLLARHVVAAKQREFELIQASEVDWVVVRPPRVTDGPLTGRYRTGRIRLGPRSAISRADLADFMVRQLTDDTYLGQAPFIGY